MDALIMTVQLLLGLSILVGVHEAGHMIAAKYFGMRVEKYSIGFPPKIFSFQKGETEYSLGAVPLGGFVKISGMVDESLDTKEMESEPEPWEFRAKPAWQRLIVMMGGIIVNVITGILVFWVLTYTYGETYVPAHKIEGVYAGEIAQDMGLKTGDKIVRVNGKAIDRFEEAMGPDVLLGSNPTYTVKRDGELKTISLPSGLAGKLSSEEKRQQFIQPLMRFKIGKVIEGMPAAEAGLQQGDKILKVNDKEIQYFHELKNILAEHKGKEVRLKVKRKQETRTLTSNVTEDGKLGFQANPQLPSETRHFGFFASLKQGTGKAFGAVSNTIKGFSKIFQGEISASKSISGPIGIAQHFGGSWNAKRFWSLVGLLSMILAFMNFLPIPALDGGHVMFLTYEIIVGKAPSQKFLENAQKVGMVFLLALMAFVLGNDLYKISDNIYKSISDFF